MSASSLPSSPWVVLKFGGTSVSTLGSWTSIASRVRKLREASSTTNVWVVVSAISQVTNNLERCLEQASSRSTTLAEGSDESMLPVPAFRWIVQRHVKLARDIGFIASPPAPQEGRSQDDDALEWSLWNWSALLPPFVAQKLRELERTLEGIQLTGEVSCRLRARVMATGELCSSHLGYLALSGQGCPEVSATAGGSSTISWADSRKLLCVRDRPGETEDSKYLNADVEPVVDRARAEKECNGANVVISQGFIASSRGSTALLGRGGSDTSGALIAAMLNAKRYEVWTDVHGLFSCDPRQVPNARLISEISYREAQELASMGAKVLHPRCLSPAGFAGVPVEIHNTLDPESAECTRISGSEDLVDTSTQIMAVARRAGQVLLTLENFDMWGAHGFLAKCFAPFEHNGISVDLIATSQYAVSMTLDHVPGGVQGEPFRALVHQLGALGKVSVVESCVVVSIVGRRLRSALGSLSGVFKAFDNHNVLLVSESTEDLNLSFVIEDTSEGVDDLVRRIHELVFDGSSANPNPTPGRSRKSLFGPTWTELRMRVDDRAAEVPASPSWTSENRKVSVHAETKEPSSPKSPSAKASSPAVASTPSGSPRPSPSHISARKQLMMDTDSLQLPSSASDAHYLRSLLLVAPGVKKFLDPKYLPLIEQ